MTGTDGMGEQERAREVEVDQPLPVAEAQLVDRRTGFADDRAAGDGVDQDVDPAEFRHDRADRRLHVLLVEGIAQPPMRSAAGLIQLRHRAVEPLLVVVDRDDDAAVLRDDVGGGAADAARRRGDQRHLVVKAHPSPFRPPCCTGTLRQQQHGRGGRCNSGYPSAASGAVVARRERPSPVFGLRRARRRATPTRRFARPP